MPEAKYVSIETPHCRRKMRKLQRHSSGSSQLSLAVEKTLVSHDFYCNLPSANSTASATS